MVATISTGEPSTLKTYRKIAAALAGENSAATKFFDEKISCQGEDMEVIQSEQQMMYLIMQMTLGSEQRDVDDVLQESMQEPAELHTPGPWTCERLMDQSGEPYATHYEAHIDIGVCMVWAPPGNLEQEANARLIKESPMMLKALQDCLSDAIEPREEEEGRTCALGDFVRRTIANAVGNVLK